MILMWSAPWRICSRTDFSTSDTPSDWRMPNRMALQQWQRMPKSVRLRGSLCPPVGPIAAPAMNRRGPGMSPCVDRGLDAPVGAAGVAHAW